MPQDGSSLKPNPDLTWFGKIQSDFANSAAALAGSKALAQQAASINASMKLGANPFIDFKSSGALQALNQPQASANVASAFLRMRDDQPFKAAEAMRRSRVMGIDSSAWKRTTGLENSIAALAKINNLLPDISALAGIGQVVPPKRVLTGFNLSAAAQASIAAQSSIGRAMVPRGLTEAIEQATKHLTASEQLLKQMQGLPFSPGVQAAIGMPASLFPDFETFTAVSKIVGEHYSKPNIDNVLRRFEQLEKELHLDIPVETAADIDDLVEDAEAVEFVESQITENWAIKPPVSQALFGFNLSELTLTQSGSLVVFGGVTLEYVHEVLSALLDENATAARLFAALVINFIAVYGSAMIADGELGKGKDSPAA